MDLVEPIDLVFQNLSYTVTDKEQSKILKKDIKKTILNNYFRTIKIRKCYRKLIS